MDLIFPNIKMRWIFLRRLHQPVQRFHFLSNRNIQSSCKTFIYSPDVNVAKKNGLPIVALESAVITHGMPYPHNLETAIKVEDAVRKKGAVPATIGILNGQIHIGLNEEQLTTMAQSDSQRTVKCSCRDISTIVSRKLNGGTTVSSTMVIANLTGLPIMATGGIGGVHRGAEFTFDISADLMELGRTDVAVVCSGVKSILDIEKTLEYLETLGVPVIKIGNNDYFPAFYCSETTQKIKVPHRVSNSMEAANILNVQKAIGLQRGLVFAVPIPEEHSLDAEVIETAIIKAVENAKEQNITGKNVTPFLLKKLNEITCGQSLHANIALIENNAIVAAEIAVNLAESNNKNAAESNMPRGFLAQGRNPVVIGGAIMDTTLQVMESEIRDDGRTHAGRSREGCGGVGRNIANALISLGLNGTRLISVVSNDQPGKAIIKSLGEGGQTVEKLSNMNTARYTAIIDSKGECCFGVGEMEIFAQIKPSLVKKHQSIVENASLIIIDGNIPLDTIRCVIDVATSSKIPIWYEPTDIKKATKIFEASSRWQNILHFISPNKNELVAIGKYLGIRVPEHEEHLDVKEVKIIAEQVAEFVPAVITTLGSQGVLVVRKAMGSDPFYDRDSRLVVQKNTNSRLYPPILYNSDSLNAVCNVTGCGDCLTGGIIYGIHRNLSEETCLSLGLKAAALSLTSLDAVPSSLSILNDHVKAYQQ